ncbi:hypothetical protein BH11ACT8_BH11ACT8_11930 [soil metagenome]
MSSTTIARTIGATFGLVFVLVNAGTVDTPWSWVLRALGVVAFAGVMWRAWSHADVAVQPRPSALRVYWASVALEVVALIAGTRLLAAHGHGEYGVAWVAFVVGFHFLPFAWAFRVPSFLGLGLVLMALGVLGAVLGLAGAGDGAIAVAAGVGSGFVLVAWAAGPGATGSASSRPGAPGAGPGSRLGE